VVYGEGDPYAALMLVGEAPGKDEDHTGRPFQGASGRTLNRLLAEAGIDRSRAWITNTALCRPTRGTPPRDRPPASDEVQACAPHLDAQLSIVRPVVVVTLGSVATKRVAGPLVKVTSGRRQVVTVGSLIVVPTYHPMALRWGVGRRATAIADLRRANEIAHGARSIGRGHPATLGETS